MKYVHVLSYKVAPGIVLHYMCVTDQEEIHRNGETITCIPSPSFAWKVAQKNGWEYRGPEVERTALAHEPKVKKAKKDTVKPSAKCLNDARKALGKKPYADPGNYLVGDGYFARSCINVHGQAMWDAACDIVRGE